LIFQVEPWLPGEPVQASPSSDQVSAAVAALAEVHRRLRVYRQKGMSPGLSNRLAEAQSLRNGELSRLVGIVRSFEPSHESRLADDCLLLVAKFSRWLEHVLSREQRQVPLQPCLRDCRFEHFLFEGARLSGLVDYGAMDLESPAADWARLFMGWYGNEWQSVAQRMMVTIPDIEESTWRLLPLFEQTAIVLNPLRWIRWHFVDRRTFDCEGVVARSLEEGLARLRKFNPW
jgi:homoserine kinase type II